MSIALVAQPWWVNLLVLIPPLAWFSWRRSGVPVTARQLAISGLFAASFGFLEAVVVVYLRAAAGLLPGYQGTLSDVIRMSGQFYAQSQAITQFPKSLLTLEVLREAATILMLLTVALLTSANSRARALAFPGVVSSPGQRSRPRRRPLLPRFAAKELIRRWLDTKVEVCKQGLGRSRKLSKFPLHQRNAMPRKAPRNVALRKSHRNDALRRAHPWGAPPWTVDFRPAPRALPDHVDFAIVGGGFSGLSAAAWLRRLAPGRSVLVLESASLGEGASGRTGGMALAETAAGKLPSLGDVLAGYKKILRAVGIDSRLTLPGVWELGRSAPATNGSDRVGKHSPISWNDSGELKVVRLVPGGTVDPGKVLAGLARAG